MVVQKHASEVRKVQKPSDLGLDLISLQRLEIANSETLEAGEQELCVVILAGYGTAVCRKENLDEERIEFGPRDMLFGPPRTVVSIQASNVVAMAYWAPSELGAEFAYLPFAAIDADTTRHLQVGAAASSSVRDVWKYVDSDFECSRLMVGICENRVGNWTAWPPHEHNVEREEVYTYFGMDSSFGIQLVYENLENPEAVALVRDGDVLSIPRGYHPNVGAPGGQMAYVYCMAAKAPGVRKFDDFHIQPEFKT